MNYGKLVLFGFLILLFNCAKEVTLRNAPINDDKKDRSMGNYPENAKSGHCYVKTSIPAEYKTVEEKVLVSEATSKMEDVPAEMETIEEKIIDKPGSSLWKKSSDGDLYCYEEIPPTYKVIKKEVQKSPATRKLVTVPAEYKTEKKEIVVKEAKNEWTEVLCGNNAKPEIIAQLQKSLKEKGYSPGNTDGKLEQNTMDAISKYQKEKNLKPSSNGLINMDTALSLGVKMPSGE
ncbi:MAG: peptidoglycan-binding protein [Leptospiraceae bacterium]|nr:peptidoglycan-binding protein [Leptospiraceae bacterium]